jgi:hypothetical protein
MPEPPEHLSGEALENWRVEQRVNWRLARLALQDAAWEAGETTHTPGAT